MKIGIYQIINKINGKRYIGSSVDIKKRWTQHRCDLKGKRHSNRHLQRSWNKYGKSNFKFEIVCICSKGNLVDYEQLFIDKLNPEYNISDRAYRGNGLSGKNHPRYGVHLSNETKRKISRSSKGRKSWNEGKKMSAEFCETNRISHIGIYPSKETRRKLSKARSGRNHHMYGKHHSEETKKKISEANKGKPSPNKGKTLSKETRRKISISRKGIYAKENHPCWIEFTDEEIEDMKSLKNSGYSYTEIGKKYGVSLWTVRRRITSKG